MCLADRSFSGIARNVVRRLTVQARMFPKHRRLTPSHKSMTKYANLKDLIHAFQSGELDDTHFLLLDKGGSEIYLRCDVTDQQLEDGSADEIWDAAGSKYKHKYGNPIQDLLAMCGVRSEWC